MTHLSEIRLIRETILHYKNCRVLQIGNGVGTTTFSILGSVRKVGGKFVTLDWIKAPHGPERAYQMGCILDSGDYDDLTFLVCGADIFFEKYDGDPFDVIFIDGDHSKEQTKKDLTGALKNIAKGGTIFMHDIQIEGTTQGLKKEKSCAAIYLEFDKEGWTKTLHDTPHKLGELWSPEERDEIVGEIKRNPIDDTDFEWYHSVIWKKLYKHEKLTFNMVTLDG